MPPTGDSGTFSGWQPTLCGTASEPVSRAEIKLLLADVDGTLVTQDKVLTERAAAAVEKLKEVGILFAITSGRPPRGMSMLVEPLHLETPIAAFNGGLIVDPQLEPIEERIIPEELVPEITSLLGQTMDGVWLYRGAEWYVQDPNGAHVDREMKTVQFKPKVVDSYDGLGDRVAKIVGVSDDHEAVEAAADECHRRFGTHVSAALSQPYYLDLTHPRANKGEVVSYLATRYRISKSEIATIGDMPNDVMMFSDSGLSIAMGQADDEVKRAAHEVTASNQEDGFAKAVERLLLA